MDDELVDLLTREGHSEAQWERMVGLMEGLSSARQASVWSQVVNRVAERPPPIVGDVSQDQWTKLCLGKFKKTYLGAMSDASPVAPKASAPAVSGGGGGAILRRVEALEAKVQELQGPKVDQGKVEELQRQVAELTKQHGEELAKSSGEAEELKKKLEEGQAQLQAAQAQSEGSGKEVERLKAEVADLQAKLKEATEKLAADAAQAGT